MIGEHVHHGLGWNCKSVDDRFQSMESQLASVKTELEEANMVSQCLKELFFSAMSDESNTGKVIRLQQAAEKIRFMERSDENKRLVLNEFKAWTAFREKVK